MNLAQHIGQYQTYTQSLRLLYGLRDGMLTHVLDVPRGLACGCVCAACGEPLVAKKGDSRQHHFAHVSGAECDSAVETALHLAAKGVLEQRLEIVLPAMTVDFNGPRPSITLAPEQRYRLDSVVLERRLGQIVPDVLAYVRGRPLLVEIRVTHKVDEQKVARVCDLGLSAVEIDLSRPGASPERSYRRAR